MQNNKRGPRIETLDDLEKAALKRQSLVFFKGYGEMYTVPAAFVINYQGRRLIEMFKKGLYLYKSKEKKNLWKKSTD